MRLLILVAFLAIVSGVSAQKTATATARKGRSADEVLKQALARAVKENKNIFVIFHASWCEWCHKMDSSMNDKSVRSFFYHNFVVTHLVVYESDKNKKNETPGALDLLTRYAGNDLGIPYWMIFDNTGKLVADSQRKTGENVGCPATPEEVEYFIEVLKKTTTVTPEEISAIQLRFRRNEVKSSVKTTSSLQ